MIFVHLTSVIMILCHFSGNIPPGWQRNGKIDFDNISIQHEPEMPAVLHNINISVAPGEKVRLLLQFFH